MKKIFYLLTFIFIANLSYSQTDTTVIKIKNRRIIVLNEKIDKNDTTKTYKKKKKTKIKDHWAGIGIGSNNFMNKNSSFGMNENPDFLKLSTQESINVSLNLFDKNLPIIKDNIFLVTGLGFEFNNYRFSENYRLVDGPNDLSYYVDTIKTYSKSKLSAYYLTVPLLLEMQFPKKARRSKRFFVSIGAIGQLKIASHTKYVYNEGNKKIKDKERGDYYLSPFLVYGTVMAGYRNFSLYAKYSPIGLFAINKGPELYPVSAGVIFHF